MSWNMFVFFLLLALSNSLHVATTNQDNENNEDKVADEDKLMRISYRNAGDIGTILQDVKTLASQMDSLWKIVERNAQDVAQIKEQLTHIRGDIKEQIAENHDEIKEEFVKNNQLIKEEFVLMNQDIKDELSEYSD